MQKFYIIIAKLISKLFSFFNIKKKLITNINYNLGLNKLCILN